MVARLAAHPNVTGFKDSSGERENLVSYREAAGDRLLFVGDETLLLEALRAGWTGTISGAANLVPEWLARLVGEWVSGSQSQSETLFEVVLPVVEAVRGSSQPATNKAVLHALRVIGSPDPRLPLERADPAEVLAVLNQRLGVTPHGPSPQGRAPASL
jgi:4-hydroxy-tetrahydrodipicolinate synthase